MWRIPGKLRVLGVEDPWAILGTWCKENLGCYGVVMKNLGFACGDPWAIKESTTGLKVLVEDCFDLPKCQEQFPRFSFWRNPGNKQKKLIKPKIKIVA